MISRWSIHCKACWEEGARPGWERFGAVWAELRPHDRPSIVQTLFQVDTQPMRPLARVSACPVGRWGRDPASEVQTVDHENVKLTQGPTQSSASNRASENSG